MFGFLNIDKPTGMTSHDVVAKVRQRAKQIAGSAVKAGHAGTLDPLATGVLVVCLGAAARLSDYAMHTTKCYRARVHLGVTTETDDAEGAILAQRPLDGVTEEQIHAVLAGFVGEIDQMPPIYSAIKQGGRKLYQLARAGEPIERTARRVQIESLVMSGWQPPQFTLDVTCGSGTYIRSLARDLGAVLGCGAHLAALTRTASGTFRLEDAVSLDTLLAASAWEGYIIPARTALPQLMVCRVDAADAAALKQGRAVNQQQEADGAALIEDADGALIALARGEAGWWKPEKVFG